MQALVAANQNSNAVQPRAPDEIWGLMDRFLRHRSPKHHLSVYRLPSLANAYFEDPDIYAKHCSDGIEVSEEVCRNSVFINTGVDHIDQRLQRIMEIDASRTIRRPVSLVAAWFSIHSNTTMDSRDPTLGCRHVTRTPPVVWRVSMTVSRIVIVE